MKTYFSVSGANPYELEHEIEQLPATFSADKSFCITISDKHTMHDGTLELFVSMYFSPLIITPELLRPDCIGQVEIAVNEMLFTRINGVLTATQSESHLQPPIVLDISPYSTPNDYMEIALAWFHENWEQAINEDALTKASEHVTVESITDEIDAKEGLRED